MNKVNIGIKGAYGEQNFGDDALMLFLYQWARDYNLDITFIGKDNDYIYKLVPRQNYILKDRLHKYYFNKLILGGGTQFFSFQTSPKKEKKIKLFISNPVLFYRKMIMFIEKRFIKTQENFGELYAVGIGLGPFITNSKQEEFAKSQISKMNGLFVRDMFSYSFSKPLNKNSYLGTDICFLSGLYDFSKYKNYSLSIKKIGIIVRDWSYSKSGAIYLQNLINQTEKICDANYQITFIFFKNEPKCEELIDDLDYKKLKWNPKKNTFEEFVESLSNFDLFISARFHGVIFGALLGIPSIAVEIEPKLNVTKELLKDGVVIWKQPFNDNLVKLIEEIDYKKSVQSLEVAVDEQKLIAKDMFDKLYGYMA